MKTRGSPLIGYPNVGRFGLAHSMLAWARCHVWCECNGIQMLSPSWLHLRIGPYLRREIDKRAYHRLFSFPDYITGVRRAFYLATLPKVIAERTDLDSLLDSSDRKLVVFNNRASGNEEKHFHEIIGREEQVRAALVRMTKPQYRPRPVATPQIAVHVRMGDFSQPNSVDDLRRGVKNSRIPIDWYAGILRDLRRRLGVVVPATLYSDGPDQALAPVLELDGVTRAPASAAVTDLLSIADSTLLISSGSGFSFWGAYLGQVPRVSFPGQRLYRVLGDQGHIDLEPECESGADLPDEFLQHIHGLLARYRTTTK